MLAGPSGLYNHLLEDRLNMEDGLAVICNTSRNSDITPCVRDLRPDLLIIDLALNYLDFKSLFQTINEYSKQTKILLVVNDESDDVLIQMLCSGISGCININSKYSELLEAITSITEGRIWAENRILTRVLKRIVSNGLTRDPGSSNQLTEREIEISDLIIKGLSNKAISRDLLISEKTVKVHIGHIFKKLGITHRYQLSAAMITNQSILRGIKTRS